MTMNRIVLFLKQLVQVNVDIDSELLSLELHKVDNTIYWFNYVKLPDVFSKLSCTQLRIVQHVSD